MFTAFLDTNVLWPSLQRDFLLSLAVEGMYRPIWSERILAELEFQEARKLAGREVQAAAAGRRARRLTAQMRRAFGDAVVKGWEGLDGTYGLPDPDDEHVVAAAVVGGAGAVVTHNRRDFPARCLPPHLEVQTPQEFLLNTVSLDPLRAFVAVQEIARRSGRQGPGWSASVVLDNLERRYGLEDAVNLIRNSVR